MRTLIFLALGAFIATGCAPRKEVIIVKEKTSRSETEGKEEVSKDTTLPDTTTYFKFTPDTTEKSEEKTPEITIQDTTGESHIHGFRVQIFAFSSKERAEKAKEETEQILSLPVYIEYDPSIDGPYKVRVGDFTSREEAEKYKEKLRQEGYPDAFVVETEINR